MKSLDLTCMASSCELIIMFIWKCGFHLKMAKNSLTVNFSFQFSSKPSSFFLLAKLITKTQTTVFEKHSYPKYKINIHYITCCTFFVFYEWMPREFFADDRMQNSPNTKVINKIECKKACASIKNMI